MKPVVELQPAEDAVPRVDRDRPEPPAPERSADQDDFNQVLRAGMRTAAAVYKRRRRKE